MKAAVAFVAGVMATLALQHGYRVRCAWLENTGGLPHSLRRRAAL